MYTVGRLAKKHGLSRSTLLYYDRVGTGVAVFGLGPVHEIEDDPAFFALESEVRSPLLAGAGR